MGKQILDKFPKLTVAMILDLSLSSVVTNVCYSRDFY
uniref:Uncharacterized protein n=1 Tax=Arundo donax TaxID=35708 RepID=A0A0A9C211_ARUDO